MRWARSFDTVGYVVKPPNEEEEAINKCIERFYHSCFLLSQKHMLLAYEVRITAVLWKIYDDLNKIKTSKRGNLCLCFGT